MQAEIRVAPSRSKKLEVQLQSPSENLKGVSKQLYACVCVKYFNGELQNKKNMQRGKGLRNVHNWKMSVTVAVKIFVRIKENSNF